MSGRIARVAEGGFAAVALAGGSLETDFRRAGYDVPNKAYLPVGGTLMIERVLRALRGASSIKQIRCVTPAAAAATAPCVAQLCDAVVEPGADLIGSVLEGFAGLPDDQLVVVAATDMALLTPASVEGFTSEVARTPCDVGYGFVERGVHDRSYPQVRHTWVRLREGTFCGAGLSVIRAGAAPKIQSVLRDFTAARKSPAKLASLFSASLALKILTGQLDVAELERRAGELTELVCRGILCPDPEVAVNVDRVEDLRTVEAIISKLGDFRAPG